VSVLTRSVWMGDQRGVAPRRGGGGGTAAGCQFVRPLLSKTYHNPTACASWLLGLYRDAASQLFKRQRKCKCGLPYKGAFCLRHSHNGSSTKRSELAKPLPVVELENAHTQSRVGSQPGTGAMTPTTTDGDWLYSHDLIPPKCWSEGLWPDWALGGTHLGVLRPLRPRRCAPAFAWIWHLHAYACGLVAPRLAVTTAREGPIDSVPALT
jgi:hypothetical protein